MRIIYITDIHDTFVPLKTVFDNTTADVYLLAGDLLYRTFPRYETAWRYIELQEILSGYRARQDSEESLWDVTQRLCLEQKDSHLAFQAKEYMSLSDRAEKYMRSSYKRLETILSRYPEKRIFVLPGNYDMDLYHTILKDRNIHLQCVEVDGVRIAGYGGAKVRTPGLLITCRFLLEKMSRQENSGQRRKSSLGQSIQIYLLPIILLTATWIVYPDVDI